MPLSLDFPEITDAFRQFLLLPVRPIAHSFEALALWLRKRVKTADLLEQASRAFPVIRFEGDAVSMWLDRIQAGGLAPDSPPQSYARHFTAAGSRFVAGLGRIKQAVSEEWIVPETFATLAAVVGAIADSVDRFAAPPRAMAERLFGHSGVDDNDPMKRTAGDLWGEAALIWRSLAGSTNQLKAFVGHVSTAFNLPNRGSASDVGSQTVDPNAVPSLLEDTSRLLLAGLLLIPTLPAWAVSLWESLVVVIKFGVVSAFARIEASVNKLRQKVIDFFYVDLPNILQKGLSYAIAAHLVLIANVRFFTEFALDYGALLVSQLQTFFKDVADYFNQYIDVINRVLSAINKVLQFDVGAVVSALIGIPMPTITIDDLITAGTEVARVGARLALTAAAKSVDWYVRLNPFIPDAISDRVHALPDLVWNALRKPPRYPDETSKIRWPAGYGFPDLYDTFFRPGLPGLRAAISDIARGLPEATKNILGAGSSALDVLGDEFADQADRAAQLGSTERFGRLAETADSQAQAVFGDEITDLNKRIAERPADRVAQSFETWLATGGFQLLVPSISAYFREMQEYWRARESRGEESTVRIDMTSPRILAERALLARAKVRHVIINAAGKPVGRELAAEVAACFQAAVQQAYLSGQARLKLYAASEYI
jgi:hypothetical protein